MTNKEFVQSVYKKAFCDEEDISTRVTFVIYSDRAGLNVLGYSGYSNTIAWRSAAGTLRKDMLEELEK
jgi:hypothetical protein